MRLTRVGKEGMKKVNNEYYEYEHKGIGGSNQMRVFKRDYSKIKVCHGVSIGRKGIND